MTVVKFCCQFLKAIILKTFNEIFLAFLPVESKTNIFNINIHFTENLFLGFDRYCCKIFPEPAISHPFWAPALTKNVLSIFFPRWLLVNDNRNKGVSAFLFLLCSIGFGKNNFCIFLFWIKIILFKNKELLTITKNADTLLYSNVF